MPAKGHDEDNYVAGLIAMDVQFMGHVQVILKTDNEAALLALATAALLNIRTDAQTNGSPVRSVSVEHPGEHGSQSNGGTGCGIRSVRDMFRAPKLCLEERIGQKVPPTHPLSTWLVEPAALLLNAKQAGEDGNTAWARLRGRDVGQKLLGFCEAVMYKQSPNGHSMTLMATWGPGCSPDPCSVAATCPTCTRGHSAKKCPNRTQEVGTQGLKGTGEGYGGYCKGDGQGPGKGNNRRLVVQQREGNAATPA